jgi:AcrR family transcriptional regulator
MDTRTLLITVAERLFAERGIDAVSLREINRAASQANASALHYHFGSRDALIEAIVALRMPPLDERRLALLRDAGPVGSLRPAALADAMVLPLSEVVREAPHDENGWVRFLAQVYAGSHVDLAGLARRLRCDTSLLLLARHARSALPHVPRELLDQRLVICMRQSVYALADWQRGVLERQGRARMNDFDLFEANLLDTVAAALAAPVSQRTSERVQVRAETRTPAAGGRARGS